MQPSNSPPSSQPERAKTEISIARIGLISAIIVAACGLLGTLLTVLGTTINTYFSSRAAQAPIIIPLNATQTAEARFSLIPTVPTSSLAPAPARFIIENQLVLPIQVYVDGILQGEVGAQSELSFPLAGSPVKVHWELVKETTSGGRKLGHDMSGTFDDIARGDRIEVDNVVEDQDYFYPYITNHTDQDCEIVINQGWKSEAVTGAVVLAGNDEVGLGYYKLFENSNVTLDCGGKTYWWGTQPDEADPNSIFDQVEAGSGTVHFTLEP